MDLTQEGAQSVVSDVYSLRRSHVTLGSERKKYMAQQWTCPYCNRPCTIDENDIRTMSDWQFINNKYEDYFSEVTVIVCPNPECEKQSISLRISSYDRVEECTIKELYSWNLLPESDAKPFPDYIPIQILNDYSEACLIKNKSPKASATLSRRCLQGMIRDFWKISKSRLVDEINALEDKVDPITWDAINSVRHVGNIGAHMEKDVNVIIDVEPEEAGLLIWLIETLLNDWYVNRHERQKRMTGLVQLAEEKKNPNQRVDLTRKGA